MSTTAKPSRPGVHSIDHFALEIPDLALARRFYETFGLRVEQKGEGLDIHASASPHRWGRLLPGTRKRLAYMAFNCHADDLEALREQARAAGARFTDPHPAGSSEG